MKLFCVIILLWFLLLLGKECYISIHRRNGAKEVMEEGGG